MKKVIFLLATILMVNYHNVSAQSTDSKSATNETMTVNVNDLPKDLADKLKQKQKLEDVQSTVSTVKDVAHDARSIGHEIGVAVDEALGAVTKHADAFGKTDVGRFTMAMVFLAVMKDEIPVFYKTILGTIFGIPFIIFADILLFILYARTTRQYRRVTGFDANKKQVYEYCDTWYTSAKDEPKILFNVVFFLFTIISNIWIIAGVII